MGVVQAGILFTEDSKPYGHTATPVSEKKTGSKSPAAAPPGQQEMFDFAEELSAVIPAINGNAVEWVPDIDLTPPRLNHHGVHLALGANPLDSTVTRHLLESSKEPFDPGIREILEHHDELEVVRLGVERSMPLHRIAANLRTTWHRVDRMCKILGIKPTHKA